MSSQRVATRVDQVLFALADPTRRTIYELVTSKPGITTSELCDRTSAISRWGVIKHMAVLRDAGLLQTMAAGRLRRHYAEDAALGSLHEWLDSVSR